MSRLFTCLCAVLALAGCQNTPLSPNLERMKRQEKYRAYQDCDFFADGRVMRPLVPGTISRERLLGDPALTAGIVGGSYVPKNPLPLTRDLLAKGHERFDIVCAACHGVRGDGDSEVATNMDLRKPPDLGHPAVRGFPDGRIYQVIEKGYGLMPPFAAVLSVEERWAVVAYLRALQRARETPLSALPPSLRIEAQQALAGAITP